MVRHNTSPCTYIGWWTLCTDIGRETAPVSPIGNWPCRATVAIKFGPLAITMAYHDWPYMLTSVDNSC